MWFQKSKPELDIKTRSDFFRDITELHTEFLKLSNKINSLEIDMRFLQDKIKNRIFKKEEVQTEKDKKESVFLNPYGNPI